jgi:hypothetical protein
VAPFPFVCFKASDSTPRFKAILSWALILNKCMSITKCNY